jgi:hypothetical protein
MSSLNYRSSRPDLCTMPKPSSDPCQRYIKYGKIQPMDEDRGFFRRLFFR